MSPRLSTTAARDVNTILHVPIDIVDHAAVRTSFTAAIQQLANGEPDVHSAVRATRENTVILGWADVLAPGHGGGAALLSNPLTRLTVVIDLGGGRSADTTFIRVGDRLGVNVAVLPRGAESLIMIENPAPADEPEPMSTTGPIRRALHWIFRGLR